MVRRRVLFVVCLLFLSSVLCAQPEIPVDMYTGVSTINTPFWTLEAHDLVKLFDNANDVKLVQDEGFYVLGKSLESTPSIVRVLKGLSDDYTVSPTGQGTGLVYKITSSAGIATNPTLFGASTDLDAGRCSDEQAYFMKLNANSLQTGMTGAATDSIDFALFLSFFRKKCPPQSFQKQDYFFGRSLCQIPDKLVRAILKPEYFNPLGYYSFSVYDGRDMKVVIYGCADGSGDGFFIFSAASFTPKGDMLTDQQIAFVPADKLLKNEFKVSIIKDVIALTCRAFEQGVIRATILPDGGILTEE